ncbi:MAG: Tim44 domain-containing protein [Deltaproteobacteria bacterium]|nr:Tim44 domain-containing protein [Deltaproteobacteria bacterium]
MRNPKRKLILTTLAFLAIAGLFQLAFESYVDARAGGGRSGGYRGSRSYQAPTRSSRPSPDQPRRETSPAPQQPGMFGSQPGGFMRGLAGGLLGGFLGSMLFSSFAHAGLGGLGGSGFGMIEILLLAGLGYFLYRKFRSPALATGYRPMQYQDARPDQNTGHYIPESVQPREDFKFNEPDFRSIQLMDRSFDPGLFLKSAQDLFFKIQIAWNRQDLVTLRSLCVPELMQKWEQELADLRARGQRNRMENIALSSSEVTEAWTETGQDYVTIRLQANLLDYTVDEKSGAVLSGSNSDPIEFEEFWTLSRPVGPNPWKLTAVQQA